MSKRSNVLISLTLLGFVSGCVQVRPYEKPIKMPASNEVEASSATEVAQEASAFKAPEESPIVEDQGEDIQALSSQEESTEAEPQTLEANTALASPIVLQEALYVQVFATESRTIAEQVVNDVNQYFPDQTSVIRSSGIFRVLIGPLEAEQTQRIVDEINQHSDYSTAFVISHFSEFKQDQ